MNDDMKLLELHLKVFKRKALREGHNEFALYPMFCEWYAQNNDRYKLSKWDALNKIHEILVEGEDE